MDEVLIAILFALAVLCMYADIREDREPCKEGHKWKMIRDEEFGHLQCSRCGEKV